MTQIPRPLKSFILLLLCAERERTKKGDSNWIKKVLISGTLSDKMAALTLLVQESPAHNLTALDTLVTMAKKKGKREAMLAAGWKHWKNVMLSA